MIKKAFAIMVLWSVFLPAARAAVTAETPAAEAAPEVKALEKETILDPQTLAKDLKEKEKTLATREADLNAREARLKTLEQDMLNRENDLKRMRQEVTDRLKELEGKENEELDKLAKIYSSTKPKAAAAIFIKMDMDKATAVFRRMTPSAAGKILNEMGRIDPEFASKLSENLTPQPVFTR